MENILELLYDLPGGKTYGPDSAFVKTARIKSETMDLLEATLTEEQKQLLEAYFEAETRMESIVQFQRFRGAFHLGAQIMGEILVGKEDVL